MLLWRHNLDATAMPLCSGSEDGDLGALKVEYKEG